MRIGTIATSTGALTLLVSLSGPAWSQAANADDPNTPVGHLNVSERFDAGEFGEPHDVMRPETAAVMATMRDPAEAYFYYVVSCDTPGAIRAGSPAALVPDAVVDEVQADSADAVCVVLVDESRTDGAPLLYSYDSPYKYPAGYPSHYRSGRYAKSFAGSASVGIYASRGYGPRRYGGIGYGVGTIGPYPDGAYASTPYSYNAGPNGPYPVGLPYYQPYRFGPYGHDPYRFGGYPFSVNYYGVTQLGGGRYGGRRVRDPNFGGWDFSGYSYTVPNGPANRRRMRE